MSEDDLAPSRPQPVVDALTAPFWEGAARHELVLQRCRACGYYVHPPYPECSKCRSNDLTFEVVRGCGTIFERAIVESPVVVGFEAAVPYACLFVELDEQQGLLVAGNLVDSTPDQAQIGRRVEVVFRDDDGLTLPMFKLAEQPSP